MAALGAAPKESDTQTGVKIETTQASAETHAAPLLAAPTATTIMDATAHGGVGGASEGQTTATPAVAGGGGATPVNAMETPSSGRIGREKKRKAPARYQNSPSPPRKRGVDRKRK